MAKKTFSGHHFTAAGYPAIYRQQEVEIIVEKIRANDSLIISSLVGGGKTHLVQFLVANQAFKQHYFSNDADDFAFFLFDCNALATDDEKDLLLMMIVELGEQAGLETSKWLRGQTRAELVNALKACLNSLYRDGLTLIFIFDRFEKLLPSPHLSQTLDTFRFLRDHFERHIVYILVKRVTHGSREIPGASGEFDDLLAHPPILCLPPLSQPDAELSIDLYEKERGVTFDMASREQLIYFSGGFPRLLRAVCEVWHQKQIDPTGAEATIIQQLLTGGRVGEVCRSLWADIPQSGQRNLRHLVARISNDAQDSFLAQYELVKADKTGQLQIFSPVFAAFVDQQDGVDLTFGLMPPNEVRINDRTIRLTLQEYRFLDALWKKPGQVVSYDNIIDAVYSDIKVREGIKPAALASIAKLVRKKINVLPNHECIVNVREIGYRLDLKPDKE